MSRAHSKAGGSVIKRIIECPGSYRLTDELMASAAAGAVNRSSYYAAEGTVAHAIAEDYLMNGVDPETYIGKIVQQEGYDVQIDAAFVENVRIYTDTIDALRAIGYEILIERHISLDKIYEHLTGTHPPTPLFGTADCIGFHYGLGHIVIIDFKFGAGVGVEVKRNPQFMYYGLGALPEVAREIKQDTAFSSVDLIVVQPRAPHPDGPVRKDTVFVSELFSWLVDTMAPALSVAVTSKNAPLKSGDHCRFCPVRPVCPELHQATQDAARGVFVDVTPATITNFTPEELGAHLEMLDLIEAHTQAFRQMCHKLLEGNPEAVAGHKLVAKRAVRKWVNEDRVQEILTTAKIPAGEWLNTTLKSPTQMLKIPEVKTDPALARDLANEIIAVSSGTTLARADNYRPAVAGRPAAKDVFSEPTETEK